MAPRSSVPYGFLLAAALAAPAGPSQAQGYNPARCREPVPAEISVPANRLSAGDIRNRFQGKTLVYIRPRISAYGFARYSTELRADGSLAHSFETSNARDGAWRPGEYFTKPGGILLHGNRSVGVWAINRGALCVRTIVDESDICYEIYAAGGRHYAKPADPAKSGCLAGAFSIK